MFNNPVRQGVLQAHAVLTIAMKVRFPTMWAVAALLASAQHCFAAASLYSMSEALPRCAELSGARVGVHMSRETRLAAGFEAPSSVKDGQVAFSFIRIPDGSALAPEIDALSDRSTRIRLVELRTGQAKLLWDAKPIPPLIVRTVESGDYCIEVLHEEHGLFVPIVPSRIFSVTRRSQFVRIHLPTQHSGFYRIGDDWLPVSKAFLERALKPLANGEFIALFGRPDSASIRNRVVLELGPRKLPLAITEKLKEKGARVLGFVDSEETMWYLSFPITPWREVASLLDDWVNRGLIVSWDSEQYYKVKGDAAYTPADPFYSLQNPGNPDGAGHHLRQNVPQAWEALLGLTQHRRACDIGCADVNVASVDLGGLLLPDSELTCDAADSSPMLTCFDAASGSTCAFSGHAEASDPMNPDKGHHAGSVGVIAACHNSQGVAGILPGAHHIAINLPPRAGTHDVEVGSVQHMRILGWLAGLPLPCLEEWDLSSGPDPCGWRRISRPAQVSNNPLGAPGVYAIEPHQQGMLMKLALTARNRQGVVTVFSGGNDGHPVENRSPLAADIHTISVANCWYDPNSDKESLWFQSNHGFAVDVCALGNGAPTIAAHCNPATHPCHYGGTSAAASTVSAIVGLMLSANPCLRMCDVRDILRSTASKDLAVSEPKCAWHDGRSFCYGSGRVDAHAAVAEAISRRPIGRSCQRPSIPCDFSDVYPVFPVSGVTQ